jgi:hypothetical protein
MFWLFYNNFVVFLQEFSKKLLQEITTFQRANSIEMSILTKMYVHFDENFGA